ncbi:hypothetical protein Pcinc_044098 [Petrolisthes cinctipes]|uniref:Uncharacterized protein n=1 Tax=Petrolisthes cinctipes TaxID=88211 RepID=A0AAE1BEY2_PETCI|nr:hypothetical protein Pcinc_044098 [Petrolisthes cinctipes]
MIVGCCDFSPLSSPNDILLRWTCGKRYGNVTVSDRNVTSGLDLGRKEEEGEKEEMEGEKEEMEGEKEEGEKEEMEGEKEKVEEEGKQ